MRHCISIPRAACFSGDLGKQLSYKAQTSHSDRSGAAFSSSFAPANEPRREVEESLFDLSRKPREVFVADHNGGNA
jgi:hypothetical protein